MFWAMFYTVGTVHRPATNALFGVVVFARAPRAGLENGTFGPSVGAPQALDFWVAVYERAVWALDGKWALPDLQFRKFGESFVFHF